MNNKLRKNKKILTKQTITEKGITLIALVVTIVVLLILAGVTITFVLGEGGILEMAKKAAERTNQAIANEQGDIANLVGDIQNLLGGGSESSSSGAGSPSTEESTPPSSETPITVADAVTSETPFLETSEITDNDGNSMWVPEDFTVTEGDKIDEGVVVKDSQGNEFVWVPVNDINDMVFCQVHTTANIKYDEGERKLVCESCGKEAETKLAGKLYEDDGTFNENKNSWNFSSSGYREPDIITYWDDEEYLGTIQEGLTGSNFKTQLESEFKEMATSVAKYGGFYIGRYETSKIKTESPIVKKGESAAGSTDWYTTYKNSKKIAKDGSKVTSSMIWGCQWDQVMLWMKDIENPTTRGLKYIENDWGMGWSGKIIGSDGNNNSKVKTGIDLIQRINGKEIVTNRVKNIYDLSGNAWEFTLESYNNNCRIFRGGGFDDLEHENTVTRRWEDFPSEGGSLIVWPGTRTTLYVNLPTE